MNYGVLLHNLVTDKRRGLSAGAVVLAWSECDRCFIAFGDDAAPAAKAAGETWVHSPWHPPKERVPIVRIPPNKLKLTIAALNDAGHRVGVLDARRSARPDPQLAALLTAAALGGR